MAGVSDSSSRRLGLIAIALVTEQQAVAEVLESLGLPTTTPVRARARSPTLFDSDPMPVYA